MKNVLGQVLSYVRRVDDKIQRVGREPVASIRTFGLTIYQLRMKSLYCVKCEFPLLGEDNPMSCGKSE